MNFQPRFNQILSKLWSHLNEISLLSIGVMRNPITFSVILPVDLKSEWSQMRLLYDLDYFSRCFFPITRRSWKKLSFALGTTVLHETFLYGMTGANNTERKHNERDESLATRQKRKTRDGFRVIFKRKISFLFIFFF